MPSRKASGGIYLTGSRAWLPLLNNWPYMREERSELFKWPKGAGKLPWSISLLHIPRSYTCR